MTESIYSERWFPRTEDEALRLHLVSYRGGIIFLRHFFKKDKPQYRATWDASLPDCSKQVITVEKKSAKTAFKNLKIAVDKFLFLEGVKS